MTIKGAIFDLDGTLINSMSIWQDLAVEFLKTKNITTDSSINLKLNQMGIYESCKFYKEEFNLPQTVEEIVKDMEKIIEDFYRDDTTVKEGLIELLEYFQKNGVKMYVATANNRYITDLVLKARDIDKYFSGLISCDDINKSKLFPDVYEKAMEIIGTEKSETIVFEDVLHAIKTSKKADFIVCGIYDEYSKCDAKSIKEIADIYLNSYKDWNIKLD